MNACTNTQAFNTNEVVEVAIEQGSKEWLELRRTKITSTDAAIIMRSNTFKSIQQLYKEKTEGVEEVATELKTRGLKLEPLARSYFFFETGLDMNPAVFVKDFTMASVDGITKDRKSIVEIKCPEQKNHESALNGIVPKIYFPQLQHIMYVTGFDQIYYYSFDGCDGVKITVFRDEAYIKKLVEKEKEFYDCLLSKNLGKFGYVEKDDDIWKYTAEKYIELSTKRKELEKQEEELKAQLIEMSNNNNSKGCGVSVSFYSRKGNVQYDKIPELKNVDLESYRAEEKTMCRVSIEKTEEL